MNKPVLWMVIPCYNEEAVLPETSPMFLDELHRLISSGKISDLSRVLFVNDGSNDSTWKIIKQLSGEDQHYIGISQSRNRGHQNALVAGMMEARGKVDCIISIDCDGQDDIHAMDQMVEKYLEGNEIVYGVRSSRKTDTWFKRNTAQLYYKILEKLGGDIVYNHADYRLVSSRVLDSFADYHEVNLFLRGIFPLIGYQSATVEYERHERLAGSSHYPFSKMLKLAIDGITSLSTKPIKWIMTIGFFISLFGLLGIIWVFVRKLAGFPVSVGWSSIVCLILFLGGVQLLSTGVIGEYVGKTYLESKHRPRYIISERTWEKQERHYKG